MVGIAGGVASVLQIHITLGIALRYLTMQESVLLLCIDMLDKTFLRLEVEGHRVVLVGITAQLENGSSVKHMVHRVFQDTRCMHQTTVKTHVDAFALQVHVLVFHSRLSIQECSF